jgi:hypothetical protein
VENTINATVYSNTAKENTSGVLIFDMPDLPQANGANILFYDNLIENNNHPNFSAPGIVVNTLPPGSGMVLMSYNGVEAYNNTIRNHKSVGISVNSWLFTGLPYESETYDPYCSNISIHDNLIEGTQGPPDNTTDFGKMFTALFGQESFDILTDGMYKPGHIDAEGQPIGICIRNNGEISFRNLNMHKGSSIGDMMTNMDDDLSIFDCENPPIDVGGLDNWIQETI